MRISFALPVRNEEKILEKNTLKLLKFLKEKEYAFEWDIVLIINNSNDESENIAKSLSLKYPEIKNIIVSERGKGNAIITFLNQSDSDFNIYMDIDLAVSLENINNLLDKLLKENFSLVFGSRLKKGSKTDRSFLRELSSRAYITISKIILGHKFSDLQCGFKGISKENWNSIKNYIKNHEWFFDTELIAFSQKMNCKIAEIPVDWSENRYDQRKSKIKIVKDSLIFIQELIKLKKRLNKRDD